MLSLRNSPRILLATLLVCAVAYFIHGQAGGPTQPQASPPLPERLLTITTRTGETHRFAVEIAESPHALQRGLMFRTEMAQDRGMLFVFSAEQRLSMWMKNTPLPLDMLFINREGVIVDIASHTVPYSTQPIISAAPVNRVLELNAGVAETLGIHKGARVKIAVPSE